MRGCVAAVLLLLSSSFSLDLHAQCSFAPRYSGQFRSTVHDVAVDGSFLWTATGYGVQLLEADDVVDAAALPGSTRVIAAGGNGLAYAGSGSKLVVLRRNGRRIEIVRSIDAPAAVNDVVLAGSNLFVATRNGIAHYDLVDPTNPVRTTAVLTTSRSNVTSLSLARDQLYAADGDQTVEIFNVSIPSLPQRTGALEALPRSGAVHATADGFVFVSDEIGRNSDIFGGTSRLARVPYGSTSFAASGGVFFVAGNDRTLRAISLADPARPAELFERQLVPLGGTSNVISEIVRSGDTLYVAAGDLGLLTFDVSTLAAPYPLLSYGGGATTSALILPGSVPRAYFTDGGGTLVETSLELATLRTTQNPGVPSILHDSRGSDLLMSTGSKLSLLSFGSTTPLEFTFRANVADAAILDDNTIVALLSDEAKSVWTVPATAGATPQQLDLGGAKISYLAHSGSTWALSEVREDGTTVIHMPAKKLTVNGAATGGLAINTTHAAFFNFSGLNLLDLASGAVTTLPSSSDVFPRQLLFAGTDLLVLGDRALTVWDTATRTRTRTHTLPANAARMHAGAGRVVVATDEGMLVLDYLAELPDLTREPSRNHYYTKAVTGRDRLYLFGDDGVDVYSTEGLTPVHVTSAREPGMVDVAATPEQFFTLAGDGTVTAWSRAGAQMARTVISDGPDSQPLSIFTAGDAVWVTLSKGCTGGTCEKRTLVLDPRTLAVTFSFAGGVTDVTTSGTRAFALLDLPDEIAAFDLTNPLVPVMTAHVAAPPSALSIAFANNSVLVLGEKLYSYSQALVSTGERFDASASTEQQIEVIGNCALVIGRGENPELYNAGTLANPATIDVPSPAQVIATQPGRVYVLTEHSIEIWTSAAVAPPVRRRSAR